MRKVALVFAVLLAACTAAPPPAPPAGGLVDLPTPAGERLLAGDEALRAYVPLSVHFVTQDTQTFCGVASMTIVLNALGVPAPTTPAYEPYRTFTQANVLDERTEAIRPKATILQRGMTVDQLGALLAVHGVETEVRHASDSSVDAFREAARAHLGEPGRAVLVNYLRTALDQVKGGHISPLAAYDAATDRFLILDVARYKYPPVWVLTTDLFAAMNTPDSDNDNRSRGYVLIRRPDVAAAVN